MDIVQGGRQGIWNVPFVGSALLISARKFPQLRNSYIWNTAIDADIAFAEYCRTNVNFFNILKFIFIHRRLILVNKTLKFSFHSIRRLEKVRQMFGRLAKGGVLRIYGRKFESHPRHIIIFDRKNCIFSYFSLKIVWKCLKFFQKVNKTSKILILNFSFLIFLLFYFVIIIYNIFKGHFMFIDTMGSPDSKGFLVNSDEFANLPSEARINLEIYDFPNNRKVSGKCLKFLSFRI